MIHKGAAADSLQQEALLGSYHLFQIRMTELLSSLWCR